MRYNNDPRNILDPDFSLETIYEGGIKNEQISSLATSVYLVTPDIQYIVLHQTKDNRVVGDNVVGIGGKAMIDTYLSKSHGEKIRTETMVESILSGNFSAGDVDESAVREVFEETGGYNDDGSLSGYGIKLDKSKLCRIGTSLIRILNKKGDFFWGIQYYVYFLDGTEGQISPKEQREGYFSKHSYDELMELQMLPVERVVLQNMNPHIELEAIYDQINKIYILRTVLKQGNRVIKVLVPNLEFPSFIGKEYQTTELTDNILKRVGIYSEGLKEQLKDPYIKQAFEERFGYKKFQEFSYPNIKFPETSIEETPYLNLTPFKTGLTKGNFQK